MFNLNIQVMLVKIMFNALCANASQNIIFNLFKLYLFIEILWLSLFSSEKSVRLPHPLLFFHVNHLYSLFYILSLPFNLVSTAWNMNIMLL
jgi:hypothetical protein